MIRRTTDLGPAACDAFDAIIDVRSPAEFAEDHVPGAINLPVLDDAQRAAVGTEYVQRSKFLARRSGAAMVARNIADHLEGGLADRDGSFQPLVYCWRGGQRSGAMVTVMDQVGWPVTLLEGGYQTWRRQVVAGLYDAPPALRIVLIDGPTGSGKTEILKRLSVHGIQTIDLEGLANHRGSLFGAMPDGQPSQKAFESRLYDALQRLDPARPIVVEAESSRVGERTVPPGLWAAMGTGQVITLSAPLAARARHIVETYVEIADSRDGASVVDAMAARGEIEPLAGQLMAAHYDPAYARTSDRRDRTVLGTVTLTTLDVDDQTRAAGVIAGMVAGLG